MLPRTLRRLSRRLRFASFVPLAWWAWKYRTDLRRAVPLLKAAPRRIKAGQTADVITEAKVLHALAVDRRTRGNAAIILTGVRDGVAQLRLTGAAADATSVVQSVTGVTAVDLHLATGPTSAVEMPALLLEPNFA